MKQEDKWNKNVLYAKEYFEKNGDLEVPKEYVTSDGFPLGRWIIDLRESYAERGTVNITEERISEMNKYGMRWTLNKADIYWYKMYEIAKNYYEANGNLKVPKNYRTNNGLFYEKDGYRLYDWIRTQRRAFTNYSDRKYKISLKEIDLLTEIGMDWHLKEHTYEEMIDIHYHIIDDELNDQLAKYVNKLIELNNNGEKEDRKKMLAKRSIIAKLKEYNKKIDINKNEMILIKMKLNSNQYSK